MVRKRSMCWPSMAPSTSRDGNMAATSSASLTDSMCVNAWHTYNTHTCTKCVQRWDKALNFYDGDVRRVGGWRELGGGGEVFMQTVQKKDAQRISIHHWLKICSMDKLMWSLHSKRHVVSFLHTLNVRIKNIERCWHRIVVDIASN
jgi:hypothetical protein